MNKTKVNGNDKMKDITNDNSKEIFYEAESAVNNMNKSDDSLNSSMNQIVNKSKHIALPKLIYNNLNDFNINNISDNYVLDNQKLIKNKISDGLNSNFILNNNSDLLSTNQINKSEIPHNVNRYKNLMSNRLSDPIHLNNNNENFNNSKNNSKKTQTASNYEDRHNNSIKNFNNTNRCHLSLANNRNEILNSCNVSHHLSPNSRNNINFNINNLNANVQIYNPFNSKETRRVSLDSILTKNNIISIKSGEKTNVSIHEAEIINSLNNQNNLENNNKNLYLNTTNMNYNCEYDDKRFDTIYESCMELSDRSNILADESKLHNFTIESIHKINNRNKLDGNKNIYPERPPEITEEVIEEDTIKKFKTISLQTIDSMNINNSLNKTFENLHKLKLNQNKDNRKKNNNPSNSGNQKKNDNKNFKASGNMLKEENSHLSNVAEIQILKIQDEKIVFTILKFSHDGKYLAAGTENGKIYVFEIINLDFMTSKGIKPTDNSFHNLTHKLINENYIKFADEHRKKIVDICWSYRNPSQFYSGSLDNTIRKFEIEKNKLMNTELFTSLRSIANNDLKEIFTSPRKIKFIHQEHRIPQFDIGGINNNKKDVWISNVVNEHNTNNHEIHGEKKIISLLSFTHDDYIVCFAVCPILIDKNRERIVSFSFDKVFRLFVDDGKQLIPIFSYDSNDLITALSFSPDGMKLYLGDFKGKITKYTHIKEGLEFEAYFTCRNKYGKFSNGRKVTNIEFINNNLAYISTTDSRIRLLNMINGDALAKYKGHTNFNMKNFLKAHPDDFNNIIVSASEDNHVYIWKKADTKKNKIVKINEYEKFKPLTNSNLLETYCLNEVCFNDYLMKFSSFYDKVLLKSCFLNTTDNGEIQVLINYDKIDSQIIENIKYRLNI